LKLTSRASQLLEVKALRESFKISRDLEGSQEALTSAISLSKLVQPCTALGLSIENAAKYDMANVLWDQGEMTTSIHMLQQLNEQGDLQKQALVVSRAEVLASLVCLFFPAEFSSFKNTLYATHINTLSRDTTSQKRA
jgi:ataxia telangiectasia mutated family protein